MIIDCALYQNGCRQNVGPVPVEEAAARHVEGMVRQGRYQDETANVRVKEVNISQGAEGAGRTPTPRRAQRGAAAHRSAPR